MSSSCLPQVKSKMIFIWSTGSFCLHLSTVFICYIYWLDLGPLSLQHILNIYNSYCLFTYLITHSIHNFIHYAQQEYPRAWRNYETSIIFCLNWISVNSPYLVSTHPLWAMFGWEVPHFVFKIKCTDYNSIMKEVSHQICDMAVHLDSSSETKCKYMDFFREGPSGISTFLSVMICMVLINDPY